MLEKTYQNSGATDRTRPIDGIGADGMKYLMSYVRNPTGNLDRDINTAIRKINYIFKQDAKDFSSHLAKGTQRSDFVNDPDAIVQIGGSSVRIPHFDTGSTINSLRIFEENIQDGQTRFTDTRQMFRDLRKAGFPLGGFLSLLVPIVKKPAHESPLSVNVAVGLRPQLLGLNLETLADGYSWLIPKGSTVLFNNEAIDRATGHISGLMHGASEPRPLDPAQPFKRLVFNAPTTIREKP